MRKVTFNTHKYDPTTRKYVWKEGLFIGFYKTCFQDSERNTEWTAAFIEDPETGMVHKCDTDAFRFLDKPNQGETFERSASQQAIHQGTTA